MSGFGPLSQCSGSVTFWYGYGSVQQTYGSGRGSERTKQNLTTTMDPVRLCIKVLLNFWPHSYEAYKIIITVHVSPPDVSEDLPQNCKTIKTLSNLGIGIRH
jgi:hypothetical protein